MPLISVCIHGQVREAAAVPLPQSVVHTEWPGAALSLVHTGWPGDAPSLVHTEWPNAA